MTACLSQSYGAAPHPDLPGVSDPHNRQETVVSFFRLTAAWLTKHRCNRVYKARRCAGRAWGQAGSSPYFSGRTNNRSNQPIHTFVTTVDEVEAQTGLDFFSALPKEKTDLLEAKTTPKDWKRLTNWYRENLNLPWEK